MPSEDIAYSLQSSVYFSMIFCLAFGKLWYVNELSAEANSAASVLMLHCFILFFGQLCLYKLWFVCSGM